MKSPFVFCAAFALCVSPASAAEPVRLVAPVETSQGVLSGFGVRHDPFTGRAALHSGIDYEAPFGASVRAAAGGVVVAAGLQDGYGLAVEIDHGGGMRTIYAHLSRVLTVAGAYAAPGSSIGEVGMTGRSAAPHLHFEVRKDGAPVDPKPYLKAEPTAAR